MVTVTRLRVRFILAAFALLAATARSPLLLAEQAAAQEETRRLLLYFELEESANFSPDEERLLYESLLIRLGSASHKVALVEYTGQAVPAAELDRSVLARSLGADSWIQVGLSGDWISVGVRVSSYDLIAQQTAFEYALRKRLLRGAVDLERDFWNEVTASVGDYYSQAAANKVIPGKVVFQGKPGTRILGVGDQPLIMDAAGQAAADVQLPVTLAIRATRPGYYPLEGKYYLSQEQSVIELEPQRGARFGLDFYLNNASYPGFELSYYLIPSLLFVRLGFTTFLAGIVFLDERQFTGEIFVSRSVNHLDLAAGIYLNDADRDFRAYLAAGAFVRFIASLAYFGLEPIAPWGLQPVVGFEYARALKKRFFLEYAPLIYWTRFPWLMAMSLPRNYDMSGYAFLNYWVIHLSNFRIGFRLQL